MSSVILSFAMMLGIWWAFSLSEHHKKNNRELLFTPRLWNTYSTNKKPTVFRERFLFSSVLQEKLPHFGVVEKQKRFMLYVFNF